MHADEETAGGIIQKSMLERLILREYAVADLTAEKNGTAWTCPADLSFEALAKEEAVPP